MHPVVFQTQYLILEFEWRMNLMNLNEEVTMVNREDRSQGEDGRERQFIICIILHVSWLTGWVQTASGQSACLWETCMKGQDRLEVLPLFQVKPLSTRYAHQVLTWMERWPKPRMSTFLRKGATLNLSWVLSILRCEGWIHYSGKMGGRASRPWRTGELVSSLVLNPSVEVVKTTLL